MPLSPQVLEALGVSAPNAAAYKADISLKDVWILAISALGNLLSSTQRVDQGVIADVPEGAMAELANRPSSTSGVRFYLGEGASISFRLGPIGGAAAGSTVTLVGPVGGGIYDEPISAEQTFFVQHIADSTDDVAPAYRWVQR